MSKAYRFTTVSITSTFLLSHLQLTQFSIPMNEDTETEQNTVIAYS